MGQFVDVPVDVLASAITKAATRSRISVEFTDPEMEYALRLQQRLTNPRRRQQERDGR
jgi:hypothetical protein